MKPTEQKAIDALRKIVSAASELELKDLIDLIELEGRAVIKELDDQAAAQAELAPYVCAAKQMAMIKEGEVEVDEDALVSKGGDAGAYVQGWIWISNDDVRRAAGEYCTCAKSHEIEEQHDG